MQKNKITRRWARRGTRPIAQQDQRYASTYIFGAVCPQQGKGAALVLPYCNTEAMGLHLAEIAATVRPGRHAEYSRGRIGDEARKHGRKPSASMLPRSALHRVGRSE